LSFVESWIDRPSSVCRLFVLLFPLSPQCFGFSHSNALRSTPSLRENFMFPISIKDDMHGLFVCHSTSRSVVTLAIIGKRKDDSGVAEYSRTQETTGCLLASRVATTGDACRHADARTSIAWCRVLVYCIVSSTYLYPTTCYRVACRA